MNPARISRGGVFFWLYTDAMKQTTEQKIDALATTVAALAKSVEKGFAAVAADGADIRTDITDLKSDLAAFRDETADNFRSIRDELRDIKQRLTGLEALVEDHSLYAKDIDHALERIGAIERHLGINKKIAA